MQRCHLRPALERGRARARRVPERGGGGERVTVDVGRLGRAFRVEGSGYVVGDVGFRGFGDVVAEAQGDFVGEGEVLGEGGCVRGEGFAGVLGVLGVDGGGLERGGGGGEGAEEGGLGVLVEVGRWAGGAYAGERTRGAA